MNDSPINIYFTATTNAWQKQDNTTSAPLNAIKEIEEAFFFLSVLLLHSADFLSALSALHTFRTKDI